MQIENKHQGLHRRALPFLAKRVFPRGRHFVPTGGHYDSLGVWNLWRSCQDDFPSCIDPTEVTPDHFDSIPSSQAFVRLKTQSSDNARRRYRGGRDMKPLYLRVAPKFHLLARVLVRGDNFCDRDCIRLRGVKVGAKVFIGDDVYIE